VTTPAAFEPAAFEPVLDSASRRRGSEYAALQRLAFRYRAYLMVPMLFGEAVGLHVSSIRAVTRRAGRHRAWEAPLLGVHTIGYLTAVFLVLSPVRAVAFILV
jgi:hypothetical protein